MDKPADERKVQLDFYARQAADYVPQPFGTGEVDPALPFLIGQIRMRGWTSLLDVGSGSGRIPAIIREHAALRRLVGLEPSAEMRAIARQRYGFDEHEFIDGDAIKLPFSNNEFDVVTEFAVLHHMRQPRLALQEMIRVARQAVVLVDSNNFGQGGQWARRVKQALNSLKLWPALDFIRTGGRRYHVTEGDGLWYSYSLFNDIDLLRRSFATVHTTNVDGSAVDHYRDSGSALVIAIGKKT